MTNLDSLLKSRDIHYFVNKGLSSQSYGFSSGHVWMWELDYKENRVPKNWCFWAVVLEKTLESPFDGKEIQPFLNIFGRTDTEAEAPILWPSDEKNWLIGKGPDAGKDRGLDGWMASQTQWTGVWASSGSWWWTGKPGVLHSMGLQRDTIAWLNWIESANI